MIIFIYLCILLLNVAAVFMIYKFLGPDIEKKEKLIFVVIGIAILYVAVTLTYWLSTKSINMNEYGDLGKNFITFTFVPVNSFIALPFLANSYKRLKEDKIKMEHFRNRCILFGLILVIILTIEFFYFKNIQMGIINILQASK